MMRGRSGRSRGRGIPDCGVRRNHPFLFYTLSNAAAWFALQVSLVLLMNRLPASLFDPQAWPFRSWRWERNGLWYERTARIRRWKRLLPEGADMISGGFTKKHISGKDTAYLERFVGETCRAEAVHWLSLAAAPLFALWNTGIGTAVNFLYALAVNLPCIAAQRYNRPRLRGIVAAGRHFAQRRAAGKRS